MGPFEALYGRECRELIRWFKVEYVKALRVDLEMDAQDKVRSIQAKILAAKSRKKKYVDHKVADMGFHTGENILLKLSPINEVMRFGKKGKLCWGYIGPFEVLQCVGSVAYYIIKWDSIVLNKDLQNAEELIEILDPDMRKLRSKDIKSVKVQWKHLPLE
ncbi:uncharacterized protein [Solanum lycopersicum]|uniref:uncharacterized protein n=1 Tax=Solanum lycopersicum TaxID=4081 RepID=UPI000532A8C1